MTTQQTPPNVSFDSCVSLFLVIYGMWKTQKSQDGYGPYAESLGYTEFNMFSGFHLRTVWTKAAWSTSTHLLHEAGLVNISGIGPSDGMPSVDLSSFGCAINGETFEEVTVALAAILNKSWGTGHKLGDAREFSKNAKTFKAIFEGKLSPKDSSTWKNHGS